MDKLKLDLLKQDVAEKLSIVTYLIHTSTFVDNFEFIEFVHGILDDVITNLTSGEVENV